MLCEFDFVVVAVVVIRVEVVVVFVDESIRFTCISSIAKNDSNLFVVVSLMKETLILNKMRFIYKSLKIYSI